MYIQRTTVTALPRARRGARASGFVRFVATMALFAFGAVPCFAAAAATVYSGGGGSGSSPFSLSRSTACKYAATMRIAQLRVALTENAVAFAQLSATMTETNAGCQAAPLGKKLEDYKLKKGTFDGHRLRLAFASADGNAAKNDVLYYGTLAGNTITGVAKFQRYDCSTVCNWTVKVSQSLTLHH